MEVEQKESLESSSTDGPLSQESRSSSCSGHPPRSRGTEGVNINSPVEVDKPGTHSKISSLRVILEIDIKAVDIKWSIFVTSAQSYRYDSCLKPFPPQYMNGLERDIEKLREDIGLVPPLKQLLQQLKEGDSCQVKPDIIDLLYWILFEQEPKLVSIIKDEFDDVLQLAPANMPINKPNYIFEVASKQADITEARWSKMAAKFNTIYAYHGSRLVNFHSILRYGLQQHLNKNGLFGAGIYLSSELGVSLPYSGAGLAWNNSDLGSQLSCVALCEIIDHPHVKRKQKGINDEEARMRATTKDSIGGAVPEKYLLVRNSDLVRVRYLLVYSHSNMEATHSRVVPVARESRLLMWLRRNKMVVLVSSYVALLLALGLSNSPSTLRSIRMFLRKLDL